MNNSDLGDRPLKYYAGIGSRETPLDILELMATVAQRLSKDGWILRSGAAVGADRAFERGSSYSQIFIAQDATLASMAMAAKYHPAWERCSGHTRKLHGRNALILLGKDLATPVSFVLCWTPEGKVTGGTGQSIRMAREFEIPVKNLAIAEERAKIEEYVKGDRQIQRLSDRLPPIRRNPA